MQDNNSTKTSKRKNAGTIIKLKDGRWQGFVTLPDGRRRRLKPFALGTTEAYARERTAFIAEQIRTGKLVFADVAREVERVEAESADCAAWVTRWHADRVRRGLTSSRVSKGHWSVYIEPLFGAKHPRDWMVDDFRGLARSLDERVAGNRMSWKTARNVWATSTRMARDACHSKDDLIRCRKDNPAAGVMGPDRGETTILQYLYPNEFLALMECSAVSIQWRRVFAVAVYTYTRLGELMALTWKDVDLEHQVIRITKSIDSNTGDDKSTKSKTPRTIPIEPELMPLLVSMYAEACNGSDQPEGAVLKFPTKLHHALALRDALTDAGISRKALFDKGPSVRRIRFHDLRSTAATWLAVANVPPLVIQSRVGHSSFQTTQIYIREADIIRAGFGTPFPKLPDQLLAPYRSPPAFTLGKSIKNAANSVGAAGFETAAKSTNEHDLSSIVGPYRSVASELTGPNCAKCRRANRRVNAKHLSPELLRDALEGAVADHRACLKHVGDAIAAELT